MDEDLKIEIQEKLQEADILLDFLLNSLSLITHPKNNNCETYMCYRIKNEIKKAEKLLI